MPRSPLHHVHEELGARFVDFAGWDMPVRYEGVIAEHMAVRHGLGVFDVSHLGRFTLAGLGATDQLRSRLCNDVASIEPGRAQYTMALTEDGGVIDDIIVWRFDDEDYWVVPNGANHDAVLDLFEFEALGTTSVGRVRPDTALLAVQGPGAPEAVAEVLGQKVGRFRVVRADVDGAEIHAAGTGYTGEPGAELAVPVEAAEEIFRHLIDAGAVPCGLGARDTLRLEMGYPLWGQDLDTDTSPLEAGLGWVVDWDHEFTGRDALERQRRGGLAKRLVAFSMEGRAIARHGYLLRGDGCSGSVTSGNYSPVLEQGIGMGYLAPEPDEELRSVEVEIRSNWEGATVTDPPFIH